MIGGLAGSCPERCESPKGAGASLFRLAPRRTASKENTMDRTSHLQALEVKHAGLEERIRQELCRPARDETAINRLKRQKLRIKEQIAQA